MNSHGRYGQLTAAGIEQHHRLGQYLRKRYNSLLNSTYVANEIVVRSTDFDRTLMSAQSNLAGLYPVLNRTDDKVSIQPIPIHTVSMHDDFVGETQMNIERSNRFFSAVGTERLSTIR
jgi:hypothetical protein